MISDTQGSVEVGEFDKPASKCEHGATHDAVKTVHPATGVSQINGLGSQGGKRASVASEVSPAKHVDVNHPPCMSVSDRERILWELGDYGGRPSCDNYNYAMRRAAESFFPVWEKDRSFAMFERCCDLHALGGWSRG